MRLGIQARVWLIAVIAVAEIVVFAVVTTWGLDRYLSAEAERERIERTIFHGNQLRASIMSAEAAAHGFVITGDLALAQRFDTERVRLLGDLAALGEAEEDDIRSALEAEDGDEPASDESELYTELNAVVGEGLATLAAQQQVYRDEGQGAALASIQAGTGATQMTRADDIVRAMLADEERELAAVQNLERRAIRNVWLIGLVAGAILVAALVLATLLTMRALMAPIRALARGLSTYSSSDRSYRLRLTSHTEMDEIAAAFDAMADRLEQEEQRRVRADGELRTAYEALKAKTDELTEQSRLIAGLARMAEQLQGAATEAELGAIIVRYGRVLLPGLGCSLALFNPSRNELSELAAWGLPPDHPTTLSPNDCWGLRQGRMYMARAGDAGAVCSHLGGRAYPWTVCVPLVAQGEVLGLFWAAPPENGEGGPPAEVPGPIIGALAEQLSLAIAKFRLAEKLRNQSIRDPLTNLFNRRFMEEALDREVARAERTGEAVSLLMLDVDHFKKFNDEFGHDAGDAVLQALARVLTRSVRSSDVACRYGGEEFLMILHGARAPEALQRAEALRREVAAATVMQGGRRLGKVSVSIGVATLPDHAADREGLIVMADDALRRAKAEGRDRVIGAASASSA